MNNVVTRKTRENNANSNPKTQELLVKGLLVLQSIIFLYISVLLFDRFILFASNLR